MNPTIENLKSFGQRWGMWFLIPCLVAISLAAGAFNPWREPEVETKLVVIESRRTKRDEKTQQQSERSTATRRRITETFDGGTRTTDEWISDLTRDTHFAHLQLDERIDIKREEQKRPALDRYRAGVMGGAMWSAPVQVAPVFAVTGGVRLGDSPVWLDGAVLAGGTSLDTARAGAMVGFSATFK